MNTEKTYEEIWHAWREAKKDIKDQIDYYIKLHSPMYDAISNLVFKCKKSELEVLEVGCGRAIDSYHLSSKFGFTSHAIDLSESAINVAKEIGKYFDSEVNFKIGDITKNPYNDKKFDIVFSQGLIEHFQNPTDIIQAQIKLLKEGGYLIIDVPQKYSLTTILKHYKMRKGKWQWGWEREYSYKELVKLGNSQGLKEVCAYGWWPDPLLKRLFYSHILLETKHPLANSFIYGKFWHFIEKRLGHYILSCIGVIFRKI